MSKHGSTEVVISIEDSPGGTLRVITPYVDTISGMGTESITQQTNPFGSTSEGNSPVGMTKSPDLVLGGLLDDTALVGSWTVLKPVAGDKAVSSVGRLVTVVPATGLSWSGHYHLIKTDPKVTNGKLTGYETTLRPADPFTGAWA